MRHTEQTNVNQKFLAEVLSGLHRREGEDLRKLAVLRIKSKLGIMGRFQGYFRRRRSAPNSNEVDCSKFGGPRRAPRIAHRQSDNQELFDELNALMWELKK